MKTINIFGSQWHIYEIDEADDEKLFTNDEAGFCDGSSKSICLRQLSEEELVGVGDINNLKKCILRHELIHAALIECGLAENWRREPMGHDETAVDWLAYKAPQLYKIFEEAEAL